MLHEKDAGGSWQFRPTLNETDVTTCRLRGADFLATPESCRSIIERVWHPNPCSRQLVSAATSKNSLFTWPKIWYTCTALRVLIANSGSFSPSVAARMIFACVSRKRRYCFCIVCFPVL